jgi:hypothetical protein
MKGDLDRNYGLEATVNAERAYRCSWGNGVIVLYPAFDFGVPTALVIGDLSVAIRI